MEEDSEARMILKFKEQNSGGKMYTDSYSPKNSAYFVHNNISTERNLTVISAESFMAENRKVKLIMVFDDLD